MIHRHFFQKSYFHDYSLIFVIYDAEQKLGDSAEEGAIS